MRDQPSPGRAPSDEHRAGAPADPGTDQSALRDHWHPVAWARDLLHEPVATMLLGERVVLWRDAGGHPVAAADRCPHRGTALSLGSVDARGCIVCPYHGWSYDPAGSCVHIPQLAPGAAIPSRAHLALFSCEERFGIVWVCLGEPVADIPTFPEWRDPTYRHVACKAYTWRTSAARMVENFTDFGHLGYLHDGLLGSRDDLVVPPHRVEQSGDELHYAITMQVPNPRGVLAVTALAEDCGDQANTYVLTLPFTIHLECHYLDSGAHRTLFFSVQPRGDGQCTGYCYQSRDFALDAEDGPFALFQEVLAAQDRPIVESQLPADVPLEATGELHLPFDRVAVAYRRALRRLLEHPPAPTPDNARLVRACPRRRGGRCDASERDGRATRPVVRGRPCRGIARRHAAAGDTAR